MTRLIDDLMDVSRISLGKIQLRKATMPLADAVQSAVESSRALIELQGHELVVDVPLEPIYVEGDGARLSQVVANLLNNAAKYTGRGGRIRLAVEQQETDAVVTVEDNGDGIAADKLSHVFDMFTQIDGSLEKSQGGLGNDDDVVSPRLTPVRRRILMVDDKHDVAPSLAELLHVMGNNTKTAFDGEQALIMAEASGQTSS